MGDTIYTMGVDIGSTASKKHYLRKWKKILDTITIDVDFEGLRDLLVQLMVF